MQRVFLKEGIFLFIAFLFFNLHETCASDFASALNASIKLYPPSVSLAGMGGIWAAIPTPASFNPAALTTVSRFDLSGSIYALYNSIDFKKGPDFVMYSETVIIDLGRGTGRVGYFNFKSERGLDKSGLFSRVDGESLQFEYALPIGKNLSVGAVFIPVYRSFAEFSLPFAGDFIIADGRSESEFNGGLGILYSLEKIFIGTVYRYGRDRIERRIFDPVGMDYIKTKDHPVSQYLRAGVVWLPWKGATIGFDYVIGEIDNRDGRKDFLIKQFSAGIEQWINKYMAIRAGSANGSINAGIGFLFKNILINYAYMNKGIDNLEPFYGSSRVHMVDVIIVW